MEQLELCRGSAVRLRGLLKGVDYLFHLAAEKHNQSIDSPERVLEANVMGTYELMNAAADAGIRKVVFTSSLYAYGRMTGPPMVEDEVPEPKTIYGVSKLAGEHLCRHFSAQRGLPAICLRLFFVYGPRQYSGLGYRSVIIKNFERILRGQGPLVYGNGAQELDYIFVDDVVSALLLAIGSTESFGVYNVGSGSGVSINTLASLMMEVAGVNRTIEYGPADFTNGSCRVANTNRFNDHFGFHSSVHLSDGLRRTFDWMTSAPR